MDVQERMKKLEEYARKLGIWFQGYNISIGNDYAGYVRNGVSQVEAINRGMYTIDIDASVCASDPIANDIKEPKVKEKQHYDNFSDEFTEKTQDLQLCLAHWGHGDDFEIRFSPHVLLDLKKDIMSNRLDYGSMDNILTSELAINGPGMMTYIKPICPASVPEITKGNIPETLAKIRALQKVKVKNRVKFQEEGRDYA